MPAWQFLISDLVGDWQGELGEHTITVSYRLTARDSVLLETWMPGTRAESISAYHLDDGRLMLTHYCGQGNQPRLQLVNMSQGHLRFARFDATDLADDESVLSDLSFALDGSSLVRNEVYVHENEREESSLTFTRVPATP